MTAENPSPGGVSASAGAAKAPPAVGSCHRFENVEFDELKGELRVAGKAVAMEPRPLLVLSELLLRVNEVVTKEELFEAVWEGRITVDHVLANAISKLRSAMGEAGGARIVTVPRVGYRFNGPVQRLDTVAPRSTFAAGQTVPGREGFVLERALGEASRSEVWLARHSKLGHEQVFKFASDGPGLQALKREYTLYRVLKHELGPRQDIAVVLDSNFVHAPYFIECEYGGQSLLAWAEADGQLAALSRPERLALFLQIAGAVASAHSVGVLHKDIKPGNVLLQLRPGEGRAWQVRLTDFGSGRLIEPDRLEALKLTGLGLTATQSVASDGQSGTLMYLAPELLSGHAATVQSDLYALGVMLYQVLAGDLRRPLTTGWQRNVADELLCADITRATEGDPKQRDSSVANWAHSLAELELRREKQAEAGRTAAQALRAENDSRALAARRPWLIVAFASLLLGLVASLAFYRQAFVALSAQQAEARRARAISDFLNRDVLQAADITGVGPKKTLLIPDILASASKKVATRFEGLPEAESEVRLHLGELYFRLSAYKAAEEEFRMALRLADGLKSQGSDLALETRYALIRAFVGQSKLDEAQTVLDEAERANRGNPRSTVGDVDLAAARAKGVYLGMRQRYAESLQQARIEVDLSDKLKSSDLQVRFLARRSLAAALHRMGSYSELEKVMLEMMSTPYSPETVGEVVFARAQVQQARLLNAQNKTAESEQPLLAAIEAITRRLGENEFSVSNLYEELGRAYGAQMKFTQAEHSYAKARSIANANFGPDHQLTRVFGLNEALVGLSTGHSARVLLRLNQERPWFVKNMGGDRSPVVQLIDFFRVRAELDLQQTKLSAEILPGLDPKILNQAGTTEWPDVLQAERARLLIFTGRKIEGIPMLRDALSRMEPIATAPSDLVRYQRLLPGAANKDRH